MAIAPPGQKRAASPRHHGTWAFWTLCGWGTAAAAALLAVALTSLTDRGGERLRVAAAAPPAVHAVAAIEEPARPTPKSDALPRPLMPPHEQAAVTTTAVVKPDAPANPAGKHETEQLAGLVRELAADRDRLSARVASLEQQLADVTGSITRQAVATALKEIRETRPARGAAAETPDIPILTPPVGMPLGSDVVFAPEITSSISKSSQTPAAKPSTRPDSGQPARDTAQAGTVVSPEPVLPSEEPTGSIPSDDDTDGYRRAQSEAFSEPPTLVEVPMPRMRTAAVSSKTDHAVDLGGAFSRQTVADRWADLKVKFASQLRGLRPLVGHVNRFGYAPYRLVVGPLADEAAAKQLCSRLSDKVSCYPTRFSGDRLAQQ